MDEFSETVDPLILPPSQDETQQESQVDEQMKKTLCSLPALQPQPQDRSSRQIFLAGPSTSTEDEATDRGKVLAADSEFDTSSAVEHTAPSDFVSETEDVSEGQADITVIQRKRNDENGRADRSMSPVEPDHTPPPSVERTPMSHRDSPSSESSFQSKNRSNLGSYDQCEVYRTQSGHVKGSRFTSLTPAALSQMDLFAESEKPDSHHSGEDDGHVSTPSEHMPSLQLSQHPMLVPETVEDDNAIPPSPEAYGSTPIIIPGSPTQDDELDLFDDSIGTSVSKLCKGIAIRMNSPKKHSSPTKGTGRVSKPPDSQDLVSGVHMGTTVEERQTDSSWNLHLSESLHPDSIPDSQGETHDHHTKLATVDLTGEKDVIVIQSGTADAQEDDESQDLSLHLTPTQPSQGHRSDVQAPQDRKSEVNQSQNKMTESLCVVSQSERLQQNVSQNHSSQGQRPQSIPQEQRSRSSTPVGQKNEDVVTQGQRTENSVTQGQRSQGATSPWRRSRNNTPLGWGHQNGVSQGQKSQSSKSQNGSSQGRKSFEDREKKKLERRISDMNDNPLIIWKDESDAEEIEKQSRESSERYTEEFHLSLPKESTLIPAPEHGQSERRDHGRAGDHGAAGDQDGQRLHFNPVVADSEDTTAPIDTEMVEEKECVEGHNRMKLGVIEPESEPLSEPVFRLERPDTIQIGEASEDVSQDMFRRNSPTKRQRVQIIIGEDSNDEDNLFAKPDRSPSKYKGVHGNSRGNPDSNRIEGSENSSIHRDMSVPEEEMLVAEKLDLEKMGEQSIDCTQPYDPQQISQGTAMETEELAGQCGTISRTEGRGSISDNIKVHAPVQTIDTVNASSHNAEKTKVHKHVQEIGVGDSPAIKENTKVHKQVHEVGVGDSPTMKENTKVHKQVHEIGVGDSPAFKENTKVHRPIQEMDVGNTPVGSAENGQKAVLTESSTQTLVEKEDTMDSESVDMSVVQKVSEYLQTGMRPRSRGSSISTDISDQHLDGLDKGDHSARAPTTPHSHEKQSKQTTPLNRKRSLDTKESPKSPEEIKNIIKIYSDIVAKKKSKVRHKSGEGEHSDVPSSQRPNLNRESSDYHPKSVPRRLSTQSLPVDIDRSKRAGLPEEGDQWMSARRPPPTQSSTVSAPPTQSSIVSETSDKSVRSSPHKSDFGASPTGMTQLMRNTAVIKTAHGQSPVKQQEGPSYSGNGSHNGGNLSRDTKQTMEKDSEVKQTGEFTKLVTTNGADCSEQSRHIGEDKNEVDPKPENRSFSSVHKQSVYQNGQNKVELVETASTVIDKTPDKPHKAKDLKTSSVNKHHKPSGSTTPTLKPKKLLSSTERNLRRRSQSPQAVSAPFVASTQHFKSSESVARVPGPVGTSVGPGGDPFMFHGSQSQAQAEETSTDAEVARHTASGGKASVDKTPVSFRKRARPLYNKSGMKKPRSLSAQLQTAAARNHVSFKDATSPRSAGVSHDRAEVSHDAEVLPSASSGSCASAPSTISPASPRTENPLQSPSNRSGDVVNRLSVRRLSVDQAITDTIPLQHSEEDGYHRVTVVTETVETVYKEITTTKRIINSQGHVLDSSVDVKKLPTEIVEETTNKRVQYVYLASPSRSVNSMTSGDLADISSSLSRSSTSSASLGSKVAISMERAARHSESRTSHDHADGTSKDQGPEEDMVKVPDQLADVIKAPDVPGPSHLKPVTPRPASGMMSDHDTSGAVTPLGSTIDRTGSYFDSRAASMESTKGHSYLHHRTTSVESPKTPSLFSSSDEKHRKVSSNHSSDDMVPPSGVQVQRPNTASSTDILSSGSPQQDQLVSSSSPHTNVGLVTSCGNIGSRVMAKWKDGFFYPGSLTASPDRFVKCKVRFDDGDSLNVSLCDILMVERLPTGQSVMVMTEDGDFESGMIKEQSDTQYMVDTDEGMPGWHNFSQVILTADQASLIIADKGSDIVMQSAGQTTAPANVGDVSLENLVDAPRRSSRKPDQGATATVKEEDETQGQGSSSRGRKRRHDMLKPRATSTPTPKGKVDNLAKRRKIACEESPIGAAQSSPASARRSPRKSRVDLFSRDLGPIPTKKLFRGMYFLLTNVDKNREQKEQERKLLQDSSLSTDESASEEDLTAPFIKDHLTAQIEAGGGTILEDLNTTIVSSGKKRCILLSSSYQRTVKYLQCLACGLPCVSHMWVVDSCGQGRLLDEKSYILPAGISLEKRKLMEWKCKKDIFRNLKAAVCSKNTKFVESWTRILELGRCHVYGQVQYTAIDVIITDSSCSSTVEQQAQSNSVPLVSTEWVIQSLINSWMVQYTGHPRYKHDVVS